MGRPKGIMGRRSIASRFWSKVEKTDTCWIWKGAKTGRYLCRYGVLYILHKIRLAHKISWELHFGPIPDGVQILHKCDNSLCVRPDHLFEGNHEINMRDAIVKGRHNFTDEYKQAHR